MRANPDNPKREMSWQEYGTLIDYLARQLKDSSARGDVSVVDVIVGIFRGGMTIARNLVARFPEASLVIVNPKLDTTDLGYCFGDAKLDQIDRNATILIVDDISDSGETFLKVKECFENLGFTKMFTASLVLRAGSAFIPDFYGIHEQGQDWFVFPWE